MPIHFNCDNVVMILESSISESCYRDIHDIVTFLADWLLETDRLEAKFQSSFSLGPDWSEVYPSKPAAVCPGVMCC